MKDVAEPYGEGAWHQCLRCRTFSPLSISTATESSCLGARSCGQRWDPDISIERSIDSPGQTCVPPFLAVTFVPAIKEDTAVSGA